MERVSGKCGKVMFSAIPYDGLVYRALLNNQEAARNENFSE